MNTKAHSTTQISPEEMVKLSVTHRQYRPAAASTTLNHTAFGTRFFKKMPKMGTSTIYSAVMNPALPEEVVSSPFCWKKEASASAVPQQKPPVSRSFRERVEVAGFPRLRRTCRRIRHSISKNTKAMMDRAAMKASAGTYSAPTLCATKVVPQIRAASTAKDD